MNFRAHAYRIHQHELAKNIWKEFTKSILLSLEGCGVGCNVNKIEEKIVESNSLEAQNLSTHYSLEDGKNHLDRVPHDIKI